MAQLCHHWQQGTCRFGDQCRFSHGDDGAMDGGGGGPSTGQMCTFFLSGGCRFGDTCRYSHNGAAGGGGGQRGFKGGKKGKKGRGKGQGGDFLGGQGKGKGKDSFGNEAKGWSKGPPAGGQPQSDDRELTGPYLGKGSELNKVWMMPDEMGHEDAIDAAIVMNDRVCTGGRDQRLLVWRGEQGAAGLGLAQDNDIRFPAGVTALLFHPESKWLFCGLVDGQIKAFRQDPPSEATMSGHASAVTSLLVVSEVLLSGSEDSTCRAWKHDGQTFSTVAAVNCPLGEVFALHQMPGTLWLGALRGVTCVSMENMSVAGSIESAAAVIAMLPYQDCVLAAFENGMVKVYDAAGKEQFSHGPLGEHTTNTAVAILKHPFDNKDLLLCGQELGYVTVYEIPTFRPRGTFTTGYKGDVVAILDMGGGSGMFTTCGMTGDIVLWKWVQGAGPVSMG